MKTERSKREKRKGKKKMTLKKLLKRDLTGFRIETMIEVFRVGPKGKRGKSLGFFRDRRVAAAYVADLENPDNYGTEECEVLTNDRFAYALHIQIAAEIFNDEAERDRLRKKALDKLGAAERGLLAA